MEDVLKDGMGFLYMTVKDDNEVGESVGVRGHHYISTVRNDGGIHFMFRRRTKSIKGEDKKILIRRHIPALIYYEKK